jgi:hypothetical protein
MRYTCISHGRPTLRPESPPPSKNQCPQIVDALSNSLIAPSRHSTPKIKYRTTSPEFRYAHVAPAGTSWVYRVARICAHAGCIRIRNDLHCFPPISPRRLASASVNAITRGSSGLLLLRHDQGRFCRLVNVLNDALFFGRQVRRQACVKLGLLLLHLCTRYISSVQTSLAQTAADKSKKGSMGNALIRAERKIW